MQSILASNGYASPFLGAIMTTDGRFSHFLHKIEQIHHENGYWLFHTAHEEHAYAQGFRTPEHLLLAELRGDGSPDHVHLRWIPGRGDLHNLSRQANAKQHLEDILQERITLGLGGLRMDIVPVYPLDSQGRLWEHRKRKAQSQRSTPQTKPVCARCQSMKRGCDRTRPTCGLCLKAGVTCNYSDEPVSVDARTSSKISSHFGQHESSLHTRGHPYHSTKYVLGACTGAQDSPVQGPNNKPGSTPNTSFANFTSGNQSLSFSDKSPHERSAFTPQNTVYGAVSMNTPTKFSNLVPDQAATSLTTVRNVANFQPSPLVLQHGATRHSEVLPERQVHCTPLSGNNSRRNTSYPSIYVSPYASPVLLPQSSSHGYRGMAPGHGDCTRPSSGTSPAETKSPRFSPPVSGLGVSNQINVLDSRAPSPLVGQEVSCLHEVDTNTYDCEMQEFDDNNTKINNHKLFTSLHEDVHMAGLVTSDDRFASHDLSTSMHQMTFDAFSEALTEPLPCMDCGEPDSHAWDCHIGNIKPLKSPTQAQLGAIRAAVERFDPEQWREHQGRHPTPELEDHTTKVREMAAIVRNEETFKKDPALHNLEDDALLILWAMRTSSNIDAEIVWLDGDIPYFLENDPEDESSTDAGNSDSADAMNLDGANSNFERLVESVVMAQYYDYVANTMGIVENENVTEECNDAQLSYQYKAQWSTVAISEPPSDGEEFGDDYEARNCVPNEWWRLYCE